ncbi:MAG: oligosaccharide flippase family protein, partial [Limisphaerales bacterium]
MLSLVLLSRMLPPHAYGLIGMAMTITNLAFMFRDMGTMVTIVQRPNLTDRLTSTLFWLNLALAAMISLLMIVLAAPLAAFYREPELTPMVCVLAASVFISSLGAVQQALMERQSEFRTIARIESLNAAIGILIAIILAYKGYGVWSLVFQILVSTGGGAVESWLISKWKPQFTFDVPELREVFGFTSNYALFQFVSYLQKNVDAAFIGYWIGSVALGLYSMASKVVFFPLQNISGIATRVLVPAMCRRQHSLKDIGEMYERANAAICLLLCPFLAAL